MSNIGLIHTPKHKRTIVLNLFLFMFVFVFGIAKSNGPFEKKVFETCENENAKIILEIPDTNCFYSIYSKTGSLVFGPQKSASLQMQFYISQQHLILDENDFIISGKIKEEVKFTNTFKVQIISNPKVDLSGPELICPGATETLYSTDNSENYQYHWTVNNGTIIDNDTTSIIFVDWNTIGTGEVILKTTDLISGCYTFSRLDIKIGDESSPIIEYCPADMTLPASKENNEVFYEINNADFDVIASDNCGIHSIINDYNYSESLVGEKLYNSVVVNWTITDKAGNIAFCQQNISLVLPALLSPPNAISPNGDGINDTWKIPDIEKYPDAKVFVMDKRGNIIFESERGYPYEWDGTANGLELNVDTYYYIIKLGNEYLPIRGHLTIIR